ncbi:MAG TPA: hypothetical protein VNL77_20540, partial [Roseiflexaceae bacterium]|nr:hypothetical protein [Roseiflexaceae bacterium]
GLALPVARVAAPQPPSGGGIPAPEASGYAASLPALAFARPPATIQRADGEVQRATAPEQPPAPPPAGQPGAATGQAPAAPNIEQIARQVYEHLRRRLLIDQERLGRSF